MHAPGCQGLLKLDLQIPEIVEDQEAHGGGEAGRATAIAER
jgi:hypothetical protein